MMGPGNPVRAVAGILKPKAERKGLMKMVAL
jgi:hypothetical protein